MMKILLISLLVLTGCNSRIIQPTENDMAARCMTTASGMIEIGEYKTQGCTTYLPADIRQGIIDGVFQLEYQCLSGDCDIRVYTNDKATTTN